MQFDYSMTLEDLKEATRANAALAKPRTPMRAMLGWLPLFVVAVYSAFVQPKIFGFKRNLPVQNLWVALAPSLTVITFLKTPGMMKAFIARGTKAGVPPKNASSIAQLVGFIPYLWILPVRISSLAIPWTPTDGEVLWAAFAPWALSFAVAAYFAVRRSDRALDSVWKKTRSLHRTTHIEVTADRVTTDDGVAGHSFRWAHYLRYGETDNLLLLINENEQTTFIAKRAIPDPREMDELRMLIHSNIAVGEFKVKVSAFPVLLPVVSLPAEQ